MIETSEQALSQQARFALVKASELFESDFTSNELVRSILNDFSGTLCSDESVTPYSAEDADCHRSLGCFFTMATTQLSKFLKAASTDSLGWSAAESFSMFALLIEMLLERMLDVSAVVNLNDGNGTRPYRESLLDHFGDGFFKKINARFMTETYEPMYQMARWANFFKHPRELGWILHEPKFVFEGSEEFREILTRETRFRLRIVDDHFIKRHYQSGYKNDLVDSSNLFGKKTVVIVLPDFVAVTRKICDCLSTFVEISALTFYYPMLNKARKKCQKSD